MTATLLLAACSDDPRPEPGPEDPGSSSTPAGPVLELGAWHDLVAVDDGVLLVNGYPEDERDPGPLGLWRRTADGWVAIEAPNGPTGRNFAGVAETADGSGLTVHGGLTVDGVSDETWVFDGEWTLVDGAGPGPRSSPAMALDVASGLTLLYGGDDGRTQYGDTWAFDGSGWQQVAASGPTPLRWPAAVESLPGGGVLMYGGGQVEDEDGPPALGGTWVWSGDDWRALPHADQPGPLVNAASVVHPTHGLLLLGGGDLRGRARGRVWRWTDERWRALPPGLVPERQAFGAAYDAARSVVLVTGGLVEPGSTERYQDVWEWSGDPGRPAVRVGDLG